MNVDWRAIDARGVIFTLIALTVAWLAWVFSPRLIALAGLDDLELLGRLAAVVLSLSVAEAIFARLASRVE